VKSRVAAGRSVLAQFSEGGGAFSQSLAHTCSLHTCSLLLGVQSAVPAGRGCCSPMHVAPSRHPHLLCIRSPPYLYHFPPSPSRPAPIKVLLVGVGRWTKGPMCLARSLVFGQVPYVRTGP
jgi:hypothetical protein